MLMRLSVARFPVICPTRSGHNQRVVDLNSIPASVAQTLFVSPEIAKMVNGSS